MARGVTTALFYLVLSPIPGDLAIQDPAWIRPSCAALARAPTKIAKLQVKLCEVRKAKLQTKIGLLRAIQEEKRTTWEGIKSYRKTSEEGVGQQHRAAGADPSPPACRLCQQRLLRGLIRVGSILMPGNSFNASYLLCVFTEKWLLCGYPTKLCVPCLHSLLAHGKSWLGKVTQRAGCTLKNDKKSPQIRMKPDMLLNTCSSL